MLDAFAYPVSGVMKLWYLFLHGLLHIPDSVAWILCLLGLVATVRGIMVPLTWMQYQQGRVGSLLRPKIKTIEEEYDALETVTVDDLREKKARLKALNREHKYNPLKGCLTGLVSVPAFMGLYRVIYNMARPTEGFDADQHASIGFLTGDDVAGFLATTFRGVPLPTYHAMSATQFAELGTTAEQLTTVITPFLWGAIIFTTGNMMFSVYRTQQTADYTSATTRVSLRLIKVMVIFVPISLYTSARTGFIPLAIVLYWFANNLWTLAQSLIMHFALHRLYPLDETYRAYNADLKAQHRETADSKRAYRRARRRRYLLPLSQSAREDFTRVKAERAAQKAAAKAEKKAKKARTSEAERQLTKESSGGKMLGNLEERLKKRKAEKLGITVEEVERRLAAGEKL